MTKTWQESLRGAGLLSLVHPTSFPPNTFDLGTMALGKARDSFGAEAPPIAWCPAASGTSPVELKLRQFPRTDRFSFLVVCGNFYNTPILYIHTYVRTHIHPSTQPSIHLPSYISYPSIQPSIHPSPSIHTYIITYIQCFGPTPVTSNWGWM